MKREYGKLGLGLAGAIATVGLMSAGVQMAQAEFTLVIPPSPTITLGSSPGTYNWTYDLTLGSASNASSGSYFDFALSADSGYAGYIDSTLVDASDWTLTQQQSGYYGTLTYTGSTPLTAGQSLGSFTIITTDGFHGTYSTPTSFTESSTAGDPSTYKINSVTNGTGTDFASLINPGSRSADYSTQGVVVPSFSGNIPESPLPLPAAFWPSVLTLAGMMAVGGLRLRNRIF